MRHRMGAFFEQIIKRLMAGAVVSWQVRFWPSQTSSFDPKGDMEGFSLEASDAWFSAYRQILLA
jgi:hypothetical protein